jgi:hypothetical protein
VTELLTNQLIATGIYTVVCLSLIFAAWRMIRYLERG